MVKEKKIRVLLVDDSVTSRNLLKLLLSEDPQFEIAGVVSNGAEAVAFVEMERPDVISMDIHMPVMNGFEATRQIMSTNPVPIVIVSSAFNPNETQLSFKALEAGALTILPRPAGPGHIDFHKDGKCYRSTLKSLSEVRVVTRQRNHLKAIHENLQLFSPAGAPMAEQKDRISGTVVAIGASAGGPSALQTIMKSIPSDFPFPILIVQHIDKGFAEGFADWLRQLTGIPVVIPHSGDRLFPGNVYLPSGDHHLGIKEEGVIAISTASPEHGSRPSVSFLFRSVGTIYGKNSVAILLSGMGHDGAKEVNHHHQRW